MAAAAALKTRLQRAAERKWYARIWWIGFHVYDYVVLAYAGVLSPKAQGTGDFVATVVIALLNVAVYARLQTSSPGFLVPSAHGGSDLEGGGWKTHASEAPRAAPAAGESDEALLVVKLDPTAVASGNSTSSVTRFCDECQTMQPMRTKHCKDCERCVLQYDHHCDCAGTCVGLQNRRIFILYLFVQMLEAFQVLGVAASAFTLQATIDDWLVANMPFIVAWFSIFVVLLITVPLLSYQIFLVSTNQTSWEHARRAAITYLQHLRDERSPFDRGVLRNWWVFVTHGNSDEWVHPTAMPLHSPLGQQQADHDDTSIM